jgi:hypothetical protein
MARRGRGISKADILIKLDQCYEEHPSSDDNSGNDVYIITLFSSIILTLSYVYY